MSAEAERRTAEIERLDRARLTGQHAEQRMRDLGEMFSKRQKEYVSMLVGNTKTNGEPDTASVWKLVALSDLYEDLAQDIGQGRAAAKKLNDLQDQARSEVNG